MPSLTKPSPGEDSPGFTMYSEYNAMILVRQKTNIPIPQIHAFDAGSDNSVKAPFMLMDCLNGNN